MADGLEKNRDNPDKQTWKTRL